MIKKLPIKKRVIFSLTAVLAILTPLLIWDNIRLETVHYEIKAKNIPEAFEGFKILQVSDLHNNLFGENQHRLIEAIKKENPDMIAITGDLIDSEKTDNSYMFIKEAVKIAPCYYVNGNHEKWTGMYESQIKPALEGYGVNVLDDETAYIIRGEERLPIFGLSDYAEGWHIAFLVMHGRFKEDGFAVVLSHRPEHFEVYADLNVPLVLTGHAHGGQFRIPFTHQGLYAPNQGVFPKYTEGVYRKNNTQMVVSRGLGNNVWPIPRVNNCYQLVSITLYKE